MLKDTSKLIVMAILAGVAYFVLTAAPATGTGTGTGISTVPVIQTPSPIASMPAQLANLSQAAASSVSTVKSFVGGSAVTAPAPVAGPAADPYSTNPNVLPYPQISNNYVEQGNFAPTAMPSGELACYPKDEITAADLLPREGAWADSNPATQGALSNRNLFEAGHHAGLNTQINTMRNANLQLRSDPLIPRVNAGPWSQSTYEPDTNRRQFEIGGI